MNDKINQGANDNHGLTIEAITERLNAENERSRRAVDDRVEDIRRCLDAYQRACHDDILHDINARLTGTQHRGRCAPAAFLEIRSRVERLPEAIAAQPSTGPSANVPQVSETPRARASTGDVRALWLEFDSADLESLPIELFRMRAMEIACRARHLQMNALPEDDELLSRLIRALSRLGHERGAARIFGLRLDDKGDWLASAEAARKSFDRLRRSAPLVSQDLTTKQLAPKTADVCPDDDAVSGSELINEIPLTREAVARRCLIVVGGSVDSHKRDALRKLLGQNVEWVAVDRGGSRDIEAVERRVQNGSVGAVVLLHGLMQHVHSEPILRAAKVAGTPVAYAGKGGKGAMTQALREVERSLASVARSEAG